MIMSPSLFLSVQNLSIMWSRHAQCDKRLSAFRPLCVGAWSVMGTTSQPWSMIWAACLWPVLTLWGRAVPQPGRGPSLLEGWGRWTKETLISMRAWPRMMKMTMMPVRTSGGTRLETSTVRPIPHTWAWKKASLCSQMGSCQRPRPPTKSA